jgi:hypothetical protein
VVRAGGKRGNADRFALPMDQFLLDWRASAASNASPLDHEDWDLAGSAVRMGTITR